MLTDLFIVGSLLLGSVVAGTNTFLKGGSPRLPAVNLPSSTKSYFGQM